MSAYTKYTYRCMCFNCAGWPEVLSLVLWDLPYAVLLMRAFFRGKGVTPPASYWLWSLDNHYTVSLVLQLYRSCISLLTGLGFLAVPFVVQPSPKQMVELTLKLCLRALHALNEPYKDLRLYLAVTALVEIPSFYIFYTQALHEPYPLMQLVGFGMMGFAIQAGMARWRLRARQAETPMHLKHGKEA